MSMSSQAGAQAVMNLLFLYGGYKGLESPLATKTRSSSEIWTKPLYPKKGVCQV
jgi:hypothetical protein